MGLHDGALLGLANHYRSFIPNLGIICELLYKLTGKDVPFKMGESHIQAFHQLIDAFLHPRCLYPPSRDPHTPTRLYTDASSVGAGAHVPQFIDGEWRPVVFATKLFNARQRQYSAMAREAMGIVFALKYFRYLVGTNPVEVLTDSRPLVDALKGATVVEPRWQNIISTASGL